jgi:hypothetical protein
MEFALSFALQERAHAVENRGPFSLPFIRT